MLSVRTPALVAAVLLPLDAAWAAAPRPLEVHASLEGSSRSWSDRALRPLPLALARPGPYALLQRWVDTVARPPPDGTARLLVVPVPGGFGLAWARRW